MNKTTLLKALVGSQAYGTATPMSDQDYKGVYVQSVRDLIGFNYVEQFEVGKDECYYEIRRFLQLLQTANPTVLELLYIPEECVIERHASFKNIILPVRDKFLTKKCMNSFGGYAVAQIQKAKGLNKKMNWEKGRVTRKNPLDFCYVYEDGKTYPLVKYLQQKGMFQEHCGLVALDHFRDCYALYYDYHAHYGPEGNRAYNPLGFHGIIRPDSNDVCLSSVPKGLTAHIIVFYNKDGYTKHCKEYREYETWLANRNTQRYVDIQGHNQQIDGKNLLHCRRLLDMAMEIAADKTITVRRPNAEYLLKIRRGEVPLEAIIEQAEEDLNNLNQLYNNSDLPEDVDKEFVNNLLIQIRESL